LKGCVLEIGLVVKLAVAKGYRPDVPQSTTNRNWFQELPRVLSMS
jgi:hypothetical protein